MSSGDPGDPITGGGGVIDTGGGETGGSPDIPSLLIATASPLAPATHNSVYSTILQTIHATGPVTFSVISGSLPFGLSLAPSTGIISGTPNTVATSSFTIQAVDSTTTTSKPFLLEVRTAIFRYNHNSLAAAALQLAVALRDPGNSYWCAVELYNAIIEALRIFQALTGYYREQASFSTAAGQVFYDLRSMIPSQYAVTITDDDLLAEIQAHLLEPVANPWTGTDQFSISSVLSALSNIREAYLFDSGIVITHSTQAGPTPPTSRVDLPQSIIHVRRVGWSQ